MSKNSYWCKSSIIVGIIVAAATRSAEVAANVLEASRIIPGTVSLQSGKVFQVLNKIPYKF